jgi:hypothetical protein
MVKLSNATTNIPPKNVTKLSGPAFERRAPPMGMQMRVL